MFEHYKSLAILSLLMITTVVMGIIFVVIDPNFGDISEPNNTELIVVQKSTEIPQFKTETIINNLNRPWDIIFLEDNTAIFSERGGTISKLSGGVKTEIARPEDVYVQGEGGMLGLAADPKFKDNRYIYSCFSIGSSDDPHIHVVRWEVNTDVTQLINRKDIITDISAIASGRHSGCQLEFGPDGYLWITTGDAAIGTNPQDPKSLNGKILRVDRDGNPAKNNLSEPFDPRIYSYGHRNAQGLGFFSEEIDGVVGVSIEHGPDRDDEVNLLLPGNFGWDPVPGYNETVPMTDQLKYKDSVPAIWNSGTTTQAVSGGTIIKGKEWKAWEGAIAVANLKDQKVKILEFDETFKITRETNIFEKEFGRIRTVQQDRNGDLYILTDNGEGRDQIVKVSTN